jgi:hypothetical protein
MKKITSLLILAVMVSIVSAQEEKQKDNEFQTIFSKNRSNGGYGAFSIGYSQIDGKDAFITGARAAFIVDHSFAIGISGSGFVNDLNYGEIIDGYPANIGLAGGYGGLFIEPIIAPRFPVHLSFPVLFGIGGVALVEDSGWGNQYYNYNSEADVYLVLEPAIELELNLTKFMRMAAFASYRFTSEIELAGIDKDVLNGWNVGMTFKLGKF